MNKNVAHNLLPLFDAAGASLISLHGRCKEQRYTKLANWNYIAECSSQNLKSQFFGNGDVLSWEDYYRDLETGVDGVMIGRGALIKPWIFQEIKERRTIDISSSERFDLLKQFAKYGLEYWGSDNVVNILYHLTDIRGLIILDVICWNGCHFPAGTFRWDYWKSFLKR